jgi:hypothetical protein
MPVGGGTTGNSTDAAREWLSCSHATDDFAPCRAFRIAYEGGTVRRAKSGERGDKHADL